MSQGVPRLFVLRHGETEWSVNGKHTGRTEIPLTTHGREKIRSYASNVTKESKLIDPQNLAFVFVSPRERTLETFHMLFNSLESLPPHAVTEDVREWDYGKYEGVSTADIQKERPGWEIFRDGCPGGESPNDITKRVDSTIAKVREIHQKYFEEGEGTRDVLIVTHGHFARVLIARWLEAPVMLGSRLNVAAAGIAVLSYYHRSMNEPCLNGFNLFTDTV